MHLNIASMAISSSSCSSSSSADTIALLERAAASADEASLLAVTSRFQAHIRDSTLGSDAMTSQLWEAVISSIANVKLPASSVAPLRDISAGLAAAKPPSLVAVGGRSSYVFRSELRFCDIFNL